MGKGKFEFVDGEEVCLKVRVRGVFADQFSQV